MTIRTPRPPTGPLLALLLLASPLTGCADNGFDLEGSLVPVDEIHRGGPAKDGIPALDDPRFVEPDAADFLSDADRVLGLVHAGIAKAYPIAIMNWHEVVNDRFGETPVAVTYCPLCGTGVAFEARHGGQDLEFGVSGLLYNSDVLLYDRQTDSLWSQLLMQAVTGPAKGRRLAPLPLEHTSWGAWRRAHPATRVLSPDTGHVRDYARDPYAGYASDERLYFPVSRESRRYHPKEWVLGIEIDGRFKAYPFVELARSGRADIVDEFAGRRLRIRYDADNRSAVAFDTDGRPLPAVTGFWFAWFAFHPGTAVYVATAGG